MTAATAARWLLLAGIAALYVLAGKLGLHFAFVHASATAVWPPSGIALAALLVLGPRAWPAVAAGAFIVNVTAAGSIATSLGIAAGNALEALLAASLVDRFARGRHAFERVQDVFAFAAAVVPAAVVSATIGVSSLFLGGLASWRDFGSIWLTWMLGDFTGALIVAPPLLLWVRWRPVPVSSRPVEALCLLLSIAAVGFAVFSGWSPLGLERYPTAFFCIPSLLWAAFRFGRRAATTAVVLLSGIALQGTVTGMGPFGSLPPAHSLVLLQAFMATMAVMTLVVAVLVWGRDREATLLQTLVDRIPVMITMYEPSTKVLRVNREFERLTGWSAAAARQVDLMVQCYPDPAYRAEVREFMDSLRDGWKDIRMTVKDGRGIDTSWSNVRLADDTRIGIGIDVRERRRAEADQERARVEAERASRTKDEFFAMLGHELRNPLGAITAALRVEEIAGPLDERGVAARQIVARQVAHLVRLVDDLLDVTRLTAGKIRLELAPVDLAAVARRAVAAVAASRADRRIDCRAADGVWVRCDETRLEQILANLLNNAVKFTSAGGEITVAVSAENGEAVLRVEDAGAGIPADLLPRIFEMFVQGQTDLHRPESGLGIGLTLVKRLVDLHGGRIEATSEGPGRGSAFTVRLPRIEAPDRPRVAPPALARDRVGRRVLIIEDNEDSREMPEAAPGAGGARSARGEGRPERRGAGARARSVGGRRRHRAPRPRRLRRRAAHPRRARRRGPRRAHRLRPGRRSAAIDRGRLRRPLHQAG